MRGESNHNHATSNKVSTPVFGTKTVVKGRPSNSRAEGTRWGGWDSCYKDTQSGEPADSTHRTNLKDETGGAVSTGESRYLQDGGPREG